MSMGETVKLAIKAILANRLRSSLTILGMVIGVTSVILLVSLVAGLRSFITTQISTLGPNVVFVIPGKIGVARGPGGIQVNRLTLPDATNLKNRLRDEAEVAAGLQKVTSIKYANKINRGVTVAGVQVNYPQVIRAITLTRGRFFTSPEAESGKRVVVLGPTVVKNLFTGRSPLAKSVQIGNLRYEVIGVIKERGSMFGLDLDNFAMIPLSSAQKQFGEDKIHNIVVAAKEEGKVREVQQKITSILSKRLSEDDFTVQTQEQTLSIIAQISEILTMALGGIAAISLVVGGVGIMNIMLVSVTERTREIGLRKAVGAKSKDIRNQFLVEASALATLGGVVGVVMGVLLSFILGRLVVTTVTWWSVVLSFAFSALVGIVFGVAPALRAAKLDPIQALRHE